MNQTTDWTPRALPGGIYCSPRCGGHKGFCKKADFDKATKAAGALAKSLGGGWEPIVWENLGWHWMLQNGVMEVHPHGDEFSAWLQGEKQFIAYGKTAEDAIGFVRQDARTYIRRLEADLAASVD